MDTELRQLRRVRWGVRFTLALGISASLAANVLHAHHLLIDQIIAGWPPIAVFATIEAIARVPIRKRWLAIIRMAGLGFVAGIAFWVSYWHMAAVAATHGEDGSKYLLPLSVDGLVLVSSISLVELTAQITTTQTTAHATAASAVTVAAAPVATAATPAAAGRAAATATTSPAAPPVAAQPGAPQAPAPPVSAPAGTVAATATADHGGEQLSDADRAAAAGIRATHHPHPGTAGHDHDSGHQTRDRSHDNDDNDDGHDAGPGEPQPAADDQRWQAPATADARPTGSPVTRPGTGDLPPTNTTDAVAYWRAKDPTMPVRDICAKVNRSERTVRRILDELPPVADQDAGDSGADPAGRRSGVNGASVTTLAESVTSG